YLARRSRGRPGGSHGISNPGQSAQSAGSLVPAPDELAFLCLLTLMPADSDPSSQRALRLAVGTALCLAIGFGLDLPIPMVAPVLGVFLLASMNRPLSFKAGLGLTLVVLFTTASGLVLSPLLRYYPVSGVLLIGVGLFLAFRYGVRGGNNLVS